MALWTPEYTDTALWLDAEDSSTITESGGAVSAWADKSGNERHFTQTVESSKPTVVADGVAFDFTSNTSAEAMQTLHHPVNLCLAYPYTVFIVADYCESGIFFGGVQGDRNYAVISTNSVIHRNSTGYAAAYTADWTGNARNLVCGQWEQNLRRSMVNGVLGADETSSSAPLTSGQTILGRFRASPSSLWSDAPLRGTIREVLLFHYDLTNSDRQKAEGYLAHKWELTAKLPLDHPYKAAASTLMSISGTITGADGNPAARTVRAYSRSTGALIGETTSDTTTGVYAFNLSTDDEIQRVALADEVELYNDIIDRVIPA